MPQIIFIIPRHESNYNLVGGIIPVFTLSSNYERWAYTLKDFTGIENCYAKISGNTVYWYENNNNSSYSPYNQFNTLPGVYGLKYYYCAIG